MCLCSKQYGLFPFYALPSGGKLKGAVVHLNGEDLFTTWHNTISDQSELVFE